MSRSLFEGVHWMNESIGGKVGMLSGKIWEHLSKNGETSVAKLKKSVLKEQDIPMGDYIVAMSIGWLLREDNIVLRETGNGKGYRLMVDLRK